MPNVSVEDRLYLLEEKLKIAESRIKILERNLYYEGRYPHYYDELPPYPHFSPYHDDDDVTIIGDNKSMNEFDTWAREIKVDMFQYLENKRF